MHIPNTHSGQKVNHRSAVEQVLRDAKLLHRLATASSIARSLPVLRRLISSQTLRNISLPDLRKHQSIIQRKHLLQMLAFEAGFSSWAGYRKELEQRPLDNVDTLRTDSIEWSHLNLWFRSISEAEAYVSKHGGRSVPFGNQAIVLPRDKLGDSAHSVSCFGN